MKKILFAVLAMFAMASCLGDTEYRQSGQLDAHFEYQSSIYSSEFDSDSLFFMSASGFIGWEYIAFYHNRDSITKTFDGGMLLSYKKSRVLDPADSLSLAREDAVAFAEDAYRVNAPQGNLINTYAVHYTNPDASKMPAHDIEFGARSVGACMPDRCYVNNTRYMAYKIAKTFEEGDKLTLKAIGYRGKTVTGEASINLAEYTAQKDSIVSSWTLFDLRKLGVIEYVDFELISTKKEVPAYFCMDHFGASVTISY